MVGSDSLIVSDMVGQSGYGYGDLFELHSIETGGIEDFTHISQFLGVVNLIPTDAPWV